MRSSPRTTSSLSRPSTEARERTYRSPFLDLPSRAPSCLVSMIRMPSSRCSLWPRGGGGKGKLGVVETRPISWAWMLPCQPRMSGHQPLPLVTSRFHIVRRVKRLQQRSCSSKRAQPPGHGKGFITSNNLALARLQDIRKSLDAHHVERMKESEAKWTICCTQHHSASARLLKVR